MSQAILDSQASDEAAFDVSDMSCASCVAHVEKAVEALPGVDDCRVNLARGRAVVRFDPQRVEKSQIADAITASGYPARAAGDSSAETERAAHAQDHEELWLRRAVAGAILWLPIEIIHWVTHLAHVHLHWLEWASLFASTIAIFYVGQAFYISAWRALRRGTSNMDTLIALGASVAYGYSLVAFGGMKLGWGSENPPLYFMEASGLLALISLGHYLEARARQSAGSAIRELLNLTPAVAHRLIGENGETQDLPVAELGIGDRVLIKPGETVPVDAIILSGRSSINESMISGEPIPVARGIGDKIIGGTINQDGAITAKVTATGSATALAQIVRLVESAQSSKPPVQRLADQVAGVFVPSVLFVALLTGVGWWAWGSMHHWAAATTWGNVANAVCSVLIIACPCALGLAVPAALMVGTGRGARRGILIRNIDTLQSAERIGIVVLDKTGTLTKGKPAVVGVEPIGDIEAREVLRLAASVERFSEHPLAHAIVERARQDEINLLQPTSFQSESGFGVTAEVNGNTVVVGSAEFLARHGVEMVSSKLPEPGQTVVYVASLRPPKLMGQIAIADEIKPDSGAAVAQLHSMGLRTVLLSGDQPGAAAAVGQSVGITDVRGGLKPDGKAEAIRALQTAGGNRGVAMVGDGINDAPALAQADLGIAIGGGSDIAKEAGDIVLVGSSLLGVAAAIRLSRATMRTIRQNLFLAFVYNVLAIPLAAFGLLSPLIAAAAMALSDITVIGNALLLRRRKID
jgi:Cu+-exporting ATPase